MNVRLTTDRLGECSHLLKGYKVHDASLELVMNMRQVILSARHLCCAQRGERPKDHMFHTQKRDASPSRDVGASAAGPLAPAGCRPPGRGPGGGPPFPPPPSHSFDC